MKVYFSIDALTVSGSQAWRLQEQNGPTLWRKCIYAEPLQKNDAQLDKQQAMPWMMMRMVKDKDAVLIPQKKAGVFDFLMRGIFTHAVLHRLSAAPLPDKKQMIQTIKKLHAGTPWLLYLDIAGHFCALDTEKNSIIGNLDICVRGEIASSPEYIGEKAAQKIVMMDELYHQFLAGWLEHLNTSKMSVFIPEPNTLEELGVYVQSIKSWQHEPSLNLD